MKSATGLKRHEYSLCVFSWAISHHVYLQKMYLLQNYLVAKKRHWDPPSILNLGLLTLCIAFLQREKCFQSTPDGVLMAHAKVAIPSSLGLQQKVPRYSLRWVALALTMQGKAYMHQRDPAGELSCVYGYIPSILCSNARPPVAQLVRTSDRHSEDPGSNPGWISMSFFLFGFKPH